jgi:hypothetical protein
MKWISENFQLVVLVVGGILYWLKELIETRIAERRAQEAFPDAGDDGDAGEYMEIEEPAAPYLPPPLPPLREAGYEQAAAREAATADRHRQKLSAHLRRLRETKATTTGGAAATRARVSAKSVIPAATPAPSSLHRRLRDPAEIRRAVVMREILDPPVALR